VRAARVIATSADIHDVALGERRREARNAQRDRGGSIRARSLLMDWASGRATAAKPGNARNHMITCTDRHRGRAFRSRRGTTPKHRKRGAVRDIAGCLRAEIGPAGNGRRRRRRSVVLHHQNADVVGLMFRWPDSSYIARGARCLPAIGKIGWRNHVIPRS